MIGHLPWHAWNAAVVRQEREREEEEEGEVFGGDSCALFKGGPFVIVVPLLILPLSIYSLIWPE